MRPPPVLVRPTPAQLRAARGKRVPDVIAPQLRILFVGINPGLYSGAVGHHFARPGNRFWPALHRAGLTPRQLAPHEERELLRHGIGITNIVSRTTAAASELDGPELQRGARRLVAKVKRYRPRLVVFLGLGAYRQAFGIREVKTGRQREHLDGTPVWVLPNPSGLNAHYRLTDFARLFRRLKGVLHTNQERHHHFAEGSRHTDHRSSSPPRRRSIRTAVKIKYKN